jgi:hypothetical protein
MAADLAIDVGLQFESEDYKRFVACVNAIMEHGCSYSEQTMTSIREYCEESELSYARKVLAECDRVVSNTSKMRPSRVKWWETYRTRRERNAVRDRPRRQDDRPRRQDDRPRRQDGTARRDRRPMSLGFEKKRRPMSLNFDNKRPSPIREERTPTEDRRKRHRPMSPVKPAVPRWRSRKRSRYN